MEIHWKIVYLMTALLSMAATLDAVGEVNVSLVMSKSPVKVGEQVVFTCRIQGIQTDTAVVFNKVVKVEADIRDVNKEQISTLTAVVAPYKNLGRFSVDRTTEGNDILYTLTIDGVQVEDGGAYSCSVVEFGKYSAKLLEVYRVPESIQFTNYNESDVLEVVENELLSDVTCRVAHVMPHPDVTITVGTRDVTTDFLISATTNIKCSNIGSSSKTCPLHSDYTMDAISREFKPTYMDNGQRLTCSAKMRVFEQDQVSTSLVLDVKHTPKINCTSPLMIPVNQTNVQLRCTVFSNPLANSTTWFINKGKNTEIKVLVRERVAINPLSGQSDDYVLVETLVNPSRIDSTLTIKPMFTKEFYQNTYRMEVGNDLGTESSEIFVKMQSGSTGGGVAQLPSVFVSLSSTLFVLTSSILLSR